MKSSPFIRSIKCDSNNCKQRVTLNFVRHFDRCHTLNKISVGVTIYMEANFMECTHNDIND